MVVAHGLIEGKLISTPSQLMGMPSVFAGSDFTLTKASFENKE